MENVFEQLLGSTRTARQSLIDDADGVSLGDLLSDAEDLAKTLRSIVVARLQPVALWLPMSRELVAAILAVRSVGCVYSVIGLRATEFECSRTLEQLGCRIVVTTHTILRRAQNMPLAERANWRNCVVAEYTTASPAYEFDPNDACVIFTSGSTSSPKGAILTDLSISNNARGVAEFICLSPLDRSVVFTPPQFAFAQSQILSHLFAGAPFLPWPSGVGPGDLLWRRLSDVGASGIAANPSAYDLLLRSVSGGPAVRSIRYVITAGQPLLSGVAARLRVAFPNAKIASCYGCTENTLRATFHWLSPWDESPAPVLPVGRPIRGTKVDIVTTSGAIAETGIHGTVRISGTSLMRGYLSELKSSQDRIAFFDTEDIGFVDDAGDLHLVGRSSARMNVGNEKVSPEEVESVIAGVNGVEDCAVGPLEDEVLQEVPAALLVVAESFDPTEVSLAVQKECERLLTRAKRPKHVFVIDKADLPRTEYGKLSRRQLPLVLAALARQQR